MDITFEDIEDIKDIGTGSAYAISKYAYLKSGT
jgi:hypothetical protein